MNRLVLISLAASAALVPGAALAADQTVDPPKRWEDVPNVPMKTPPPPPGTTWQAPPIVRQSAPPAPLPPPVVRRVETVPVPAPPVAATPAPVIRRVETVRVPAPPAAAHHAPPSHHAPTAHHAPAHGDKMIREGHDRMAVHHAGDRVEHVRVEKHHPGHPPLGRGDHGYDAGYDYATEWEESGWEYDGRGGAVYVGDGDYYADDYGYDERGHGYGYEQGQSYPGGWYGHPGYQGGYGHYGWGTVTVTETTVTTEGTVCCEKVHVAPAQKVVKRRYKSQPRARKGERG